MSKYLLYLNDGICERTKSLSNSVTSEARNRMNSDCLNPADKDDVVFNILLCFGGLRLNSANAFKLHYPTYVGDSRPYGPREASPNPVK